MNSHSSTNTSASISLGSPPKLDADQVTDHPTRTRLLETTIELLEQQSPDEVQVDAILKASGVSKGSLYHHFEDGRALIDEALLRKFSSGVDEHAGIIAQILGSADTQLEAAFAFRLLTIDSQRSDLRYRRSSRMAKILRAERDPAFAEKLSLEQIRLNDSFSVQIVRMQEKGWFRDDFDPAAGALLIQSYTLGRRLGQITADIVTEDAWNTMIFRIIEQGLMGLTVEASASLDANMLTDPRFIK
jgi:AcrR family transcriptional regulator